MFQSDLIRSLCVDAEKKPCSGEECFDKDCLSAAKRHGHEILHSFTRAVKQSGDVLRTTIVVQQPGDVSTVVGSLLASFETRGWKIVEFENLWNPPIRSSGYVAVHMQVLVCGRSEAESHCPENFFQWRDFEHRVDAFPAIIAELQVHLGAILGAKEQAHVAYEYSRKQEDGSEEQQDADAAALAIFCHSLYDSLPAAERRQCVQ